MRHNLFKKHTIESLKQHVSSLKKIIILTDIDDDRLYKALHQILDAKICVPILVGDGDVIIRKLKKHGLDDRMIAFFEPSAHPKINDFANEYYKLRKHKGMSLSNARQIILNPVYFGAMLVRKGIADGMVSGLSSKTKPFIPAFHIIGIEKGFKRASGMFIMELKKHNKSDKTDNTIYFADCALNINPDKHQLAEIAVLTARTVRMLGDNPKVAMLSFSTYGSAKHELVKKVQDATRIAKGISRKKGFGIAFDGEIQFDAAFIPEVHRMKCPNSLMKGAANVFIFPNLDVGNIAYKIAERIGGAKATGPILQGLKHPVNDLSRGCSPSDIVGVCAVTCFQAVQKTR